MKVVQINATCGVGSTGRICTSVSDLLTAEGHESFILYSSGESDYPCGIKCSDERYIKMQALKARVFGNWGFNSGRATRRIIDELERIEPDIVHLHNIHGHDCDLEQLFGYFKNKKTKLIWTFHDCWAFTGYCVHFLMEGCRKWEKRCGDCPLKGQYSWIFDRSGELQDRKKRLLSDLEMTVVTPSHWLADLARRSFLKNHPVKVIGNGIDLSVFKPAEENVRRELKCEDEYIVLGVSFGWSISKGFDVFCELAGRLGDRYRIILVGTDSETESQLPENIISIRRTENRAQLARLYTAADVFVNPTREDSYPTVNMEAIACGTPVVTFRTGGCPETIGEKCGSVVECGDVNALETEIRRVCETRAFSREDCLKKALEFDREERFRDYIDLYKEIYDRASEN